MGLAVSRNVVELARQVLRRSQAPSATAFTLSTFTLHVDDPESRETFVSPDEVARLTKAHRSTLYRHHLPLLEELGELVPVGRRGRSVLRRVMPGVDLSHPGCDTSGPEVSRSSRGTVADMSPLVRHEVEGEEEGKTPLTPLAGGSGERDQVAGVAAAAADLAASAEARASWSAVREELRGLLTDYAFHIWIDPLRPLRFSDDGALRLWAPRHIASWVRDRYGRLLQSAAREALGADARVELVLEPAADAAAPKRTRRRHRPRSAT